MFNVPPLRFPEFSEEWTDTTIGSIATIVGGGTPDTTQKDNWDGDILWYTPSEIGKEKYISDSERRITVAGLKNSGAKLLPKGTILLTSRATIGECSISTYECTTNQGFQSLIANHDINNEFLFYLIASKRKELLKKACGSTFLEISANEVRKIKVKNTSIEEQNKIAALLSLIDERIATQSRIIEDLKKLKSAIVDKLYSHADGVTYSYCQLFEIVNEKNENLTFTNILSASQEFGMIERSDLDIDIKFEQDSIVRYKVVRQGDYVVHLRSFQGGYAFSDKTGICSPAYTILRPNKLILYGYLSHYFTSKLFIKSLKLVTYGIRDGRSINVDEWLNMKVTIPSLNVQHRTLSIIRCIECKLLNEIKIADNLLKERSYLLRQMFI